MWFRHEREKLKNVEYKNGLRNIRESEIRKPIKEKYNSLSVAEKSTYVDDKKANYRQYKEKLAQGAPKYTICTRMSVIGAHNRFRKVNRVGKSFGFKAFHHLYRTMLDFG
ncbi:hypothetical protein ACJIZ3_011437 [Penstemon smallii]|uniref:HMG box domain-containing protein n=1 Tax=Penstemon smallii TaxID=265156 RepID=A0ABD3UKJ5_9LAMI